jgi:hypothetical protein
MPSLTDLNALAEKLAAATPDLNLDSDPQEE